MAFVFTNTPALAYIADPVTRAVRAYFSKFEKITVEFDSPMDYAYGGASTMPMIAIAKDRKPAASMTGPEIPLHAMDGILGTKTSAASNATPMVVPWAEARLIGPDGQLTEPLSYPISATDQTVNVITDLDYTKFSAAASAPTQSQFATPTAGATQIQFNTADAGKVVNIAYNFDSNTGGKIGWTGTSTPLVHRFVAPGMCQDTADPSRAPFPATIVIPQCQFSGKWSVDMERQKVSQSKTDLSILDPGPGQNAIEIYPTRKIS